MLAPRLIDNKLKLLQFLANEIINTFKELTNCPSILTRNMSRHMPRSVLANSNIYFNSFLPRTIRNLKISEVIILFREGLFFPLESLETQHRRRYRILTLTLELKVSAKGEAIELDN